MADVRLFLHASPTTRRKIKANPKLLKDPLFKLPIHISYPVRPGRFRISTGIVVAPIQWDKTQQKVNRRHKNYSDLNRHLDFLVSKVDKAYWEMVYSNETPTPERLKQILKPAKEQEGEKTFWDYLKIYLNAESVSITEATKRKIKSVFSVIKRYETFSGNPITFQSIDYQFYSGYVNYLIEERNLLSNTIGKHIKCLKRFMNYGLEKDWHTNTEHRKSYFKAPKDVIAVERPTTEEVETLIKTKLSKPNLEQARDMFVFACLTALRIEDILNLCPENIVGNEIVLKTQKNRKNVKIPLTKVSKAIVERYKGNPLLVFPKISQQKARVNLKSAAQEAQLTREFIRHRTQGTKARTEKLRVCDMIGFHHAKRFAVSFMLQSGMDRETVMRITGNTSATIEHYIKMDSKHVRETFLNTMNDAFSS